MKRKLLGGAVLLIAAFSLTEANAQTCTAAPTCAQLGYTMKKADCGDYPVMRCPFAVSDDNQVYCQKSVITLPLPILYGDGTISTEIFSSKTPIGIVFDEPNRLAIALTDVKKDGSAGTEKMAWANSHTYVVPGFKECSYSGVGTYCYPDGRENTDKILACGSGCGGTPAATACNLYQPAGCTKDFCKKGKWFLPSIKEFNRVYLMYSMIVNTSNSLDGTDFPITYRPYWSSEPNALNPANSFHEDVTYAYYASVSGSSFSSSANSQDNEANYVRPVVKY